MCGSGFCGLFMVEDFNYGFCVQFLKFKFVFDMWNKLKENCMLVYVIDLVMNEKYDFFLDKFQKFVKDDNYFFKKELQMDQFQCLLEVEVFKK